MGKFLISPDKQDVFYAIWKEDKGAEHRTELPPVKTSGVALRVMITGQKLVFSVARAAESEANQQLIVIAHMNQQMIYKAIVNLKDVTMSGGQYPDPATSYRYTSDYPVRRQSDTAGRTCLLHQQ